MARAPASWIFAIASAHASWNGASGFEALPLTTTMSLVGTFCASRANISAPPAVSGPQYAGIAVRWWAASSGAAAAGAGASSAAPASAAAAAPEGFLCFQVISASSSKKVDSG
ncbi:hypothetical protein WMF30_06640 [Sorangium sp. So ce134]